MLVRNNIQDILPLLPLQETMLNNSIICDDSELYKELNCFTLEKNIDEEKVAMAWNYVVQNNEVLRTVFRWNKLSQPVQIVLREKQVDYEFIDGSGMDEHSFSKYIDELCEQKLQLKINLEENLFGVTLVKKSSTYAVLILMNHHILFDGWSSSIMMSEFVKFYNCLVADKIVKILSKESYSDCVKMITLNRQNYNKLFWKEYLSRSVEGSGVDPIQNGIFRKKSKSIASFQFQERILDEVRKNAYENKISVAVYFYLAWAVLLHKHYQKKDIVYGATFSGRPESMTNCMSLVINTFPLIIHIEDGQTVQDKLLEIQDIINNLQQNRSDYLLEIYQREKELNVISYNTVMVLQNYPIDNKIWNNEIMPITIRKRYYKSAIDLNLSIQFFDHIQFEFEYNSEIYSGSEIDDISKMYIEILENITCCEDIAAVKRNVWKNEMNQNDFKEFDF